MPVLLAADSVFAVAWNPAQPDLVASGGGDDTAYIWRVRVCAMKETCIGLSLEMSHLASCAGRAGRETYSQRPYRLGECIPGKQASSAIMPIVLTALGLCCR